MWCLTPTDGELQVAKKVYGRVMRSKESGDNTFRVCSFPLFPLPLCSSGTHATTLGPEGVRVRRPRPIYQGEWAAIDGRRNVGIGGHYLPILWGWG
jgi:hypothetical protein